MDTQYIICSHTWITFIFSIKMVNTWESNIQNVGAGVLCNVIVGFIPVLIGY